MTGIAQILYSSAFVEPIMTLIQSFSDFLAPFQEETFFKDYYGQKPLHIEGTEAKFAGVMDFTLLSELLSQNGCWTSGTLQLVLDSKAVPAEDYCRIETRDGQKVQEPDLAKVEAYLARGATLIANDIDTRTHEMSAIGDMLEDALDGKAQSNLYFSSKRRKGFGAHFDMHDVFALHLIGEKTWRLFENREPHPIRHPAFAKSAEQMEADKGALLQEVVMRPGDILYIPRGQYHDALASDEYALHLAFGVTSVIGVDILSALHQLSLQDTAFRQNLPRASEGRAALKKHLRTLGESLKKASESDAFLEQVAQFQSHYRYDRRKITLPIPVVREGYRLAVSGLSIVEAGGKHGLKTKKGVLELPPHKVKAVSWILIQSRFTFDDLNDALASISNATLHETVQDLLTMGVIARE